MQTSRIHEIDLLRFIAALAVVIFHYAFRGYAGGDMSVMPYPLLSGLARYGYLGVELFFMISGFVIVLSIGSGSLRQFFISRAARLYPALWICCTLTFVAILLFGAPRYETNIKQYFSSMLLVSEFIGIGNVESAYWSLFVELKFYFIIAAVLLFKKTRHLENILCAWLFFSGVCELSGWEGARKSFITDYASYFVAGANFYWIWAEGSNRRRQLTTLVCLALSLHHSLQFGVLLESVYQTQFNSLAIAFTIIVFYAAMQLVAQRKTGWVGTHNWAPVGALTYPLYLLHQTVGFIIFNTFYPAWNNHLLLWATVAGMLIASWVIQRFLEKPISRQLKKIMRKGLKVSPLSPQ
ncbi:acyltransferase family protein [Pseudomonas sp. BNK-43-a]|uniref:acyltransferase family protein n=1 Tax=unclassified Pseudomonas TaxID=196821 RepID=UPI0039BF3586